MVTDHLEYILEHLQDELAFLDDRGKRQFVERYFAQPKGYEDMCDRISQLEAKFRNVDDLADVKNRYAPSEEKDACIGVPWETWRDVAIFCLDKHSVSDNAVCFLRQIILNCKEGWPVQLSQRQALWALSLLDAFDKRHEEHPEDELGSAVETVAAQQGSHNLKAEGLERERDRCEPGDRS